MRVKLDVCQVAEATDSVHCANKPEPPPPRATTEACKVDVLLLSVMTVGLVCLKPDTASQNTVYE